MQHATPAAPAVRETLERVLASNTFARSDRARKLLHYLVEREQAGEAETLKGYSIAVDVFGKDADFDSSTDAVVRVQARRLRDLLEQYFATEGRTAPLRILIPRGSYVPVYEPNLDAGTAVADTAQGMLVKEAPPAVPTGARENSSAAVAPRSAYVFARDSRLLCMSAAALMAVAGILLLLQGNTLAPIARQLAGRADADITSSIHVMTADELPIVFMAVLGDDPETLRVGAAMRTGLSGFDTIEFIGRAPPARPDAAADPVSFVFRLMPGPDAGSVAIELQNIGSGRVLLSRVIAREDVEVGTVDNTIASILSASIPASGTIYTYLDQMGLDRGLTKCLLLNDDYYLDPNAQTHETAYRCFEALLADNAKSALIYSEMSALHLEAVTDGYKYPPGATADQAMAMAHRALQLSAASPYVYRASGFLNSRIGNSEDSIRWMRKAYELNTYDLSMAAAYAYGLIFAGDYAEGTPIMARAVELSSAHPQWWDFGLFAGALSLGDRQQAIRAAGPLNPAGVKPHYLAARLIAADLAGDETAKTSLREQLTDRFPKFAVNPRAIFKHRNYPPDLTERLFQALRAAGFGAGS